MKTRYLQPALLLAVVGATACNDFLDIDPTDKVTDRLVWGDVAAAEQVVNYFYSDLASMGSFSSYQCLAGMTEGLTDELKYGNTLFAAYCYIPNEISYGSGTVLTASYADVYLGVWGATYTKIRRVNEALANLRSGGMAAADASRLEGELRFFRALYYYELLKRYGQAIVYTEDLSRIDTDKALDTADECWRFVADDLNFAGSNLPVSTNALGRLTSGAAYALLSRAMLYAQDWAAARAAAERVLQMGYALTANYADAFVAEGNTEAISVFQYSLAGQLTHTFNGYMAPGSDHALDGMTMYGGYGVPTQDMVEEYELASGGRPDWAEWHTAEGTMRTPPYALLEPRFAATILYNGAAWRGRAVEPYVGGGDGWAQWLVEGMLEGRTTTGYYLRKFVSETQDYATSQGSTQPWVALRLAEVYLNHAEASLRAGDADAARQSVNAVRARVGLPATTASGDELMDAIRHERKVELAFEGQYYWDLRRWGLAETLLTGVRRHGLKIESLAGGFRYSYVEVDCEDMNFPARMNRLPIPLSELNNNSLMSQFAEWQ